MTGTFIDRAVKILQRATVENEALLRTMIRVTVGGDRDAGDAAGVATPKRGYRRIRWIELALEPVRSELDRRSYRRLVAALSLCVGIEALLVLRDVCGLSVEEAEKVSRWAARALLDASLEAASSPPASGRTS